MPRALAVWCLLALACVLTACKAKLEEGTYACDDGKCPADDHN